MFSTLEKKYTNAGLVGDIDTIRYMLKYEDKTIKNNKLLHKCLTNACKGGFYEIFKLICNYRDIFTLCDGRNTRNCGQIYDILSCAGEGGNFDIINEVIQQYHSISPKFELMILTESKHAWVHCVKGACKAGRLDIFKVYADDKTYDFFSSGWFWNACESGNLQLVKLILDMEEDYHISCATKTPSMFLESEANFRLKYACQTGCMEVVNKCMKHATIQGFYYGFAGACYGRSLEIVKLMLSLINKYNDMHNCDIYTVCYGGSMEIIEFMMINGMNGMNDYDRGMLGACFGGHMNIVKLMIEKGATNYNSYLSNACEGNHMEIIKFMIEKGATDFDVCLHYGCKHGDLNFVKMSIEKGATDWNGGLKNACISNNIELVELMLQYGATNVDEGIYEIIESGYKNPNIINLLIRHGAKISTWLQNVQDFKIYLLYCSHNSIELEINKYNALLAEYPPCVLFVGSRCSKNGICHVKRLPIELFKLLAEY